MCAAFAAAEYGVRAYVSGKHGRGREQADVIPDRWAAFRNSANYDRTGVHHNSQGFRRDSDISLDKPAGTVRIFLLGGSAAYGAETVYPEIDDHWRIDNHQTIDFFLEQKLNAMYPEKRWEVINAAVKGYRLHQDLARIQSVLLRYRPDAIVLIDGVNDMSGLIDAGPRYDPYAETPLGEEFEDLTNPHSFRSLRVMLATWLYRNSVLFRVLRDRAIGSVRMQYRERRQKAEPVPEQFELTSDEQQRVTEIAGQIGYYRHAVRQIHRVLALDGIEDIFVLQPALRLTKKIFAGSEARLAEYDRAVAGRIEIAAYRELYPEIAKQLSEDRDGYRFLDFTHELDGMTTQAFTDYCHLTPDANRAIADRLFEEIKSTRLQRR